MLEERTAVPVVLWAEEAERLVVAVLREVVLPVLLEVVPPVLRLVVAAEELPVERLVRVF